MAMIGKFLIVITGLIVSAIACSHALGMVWESKAPEFAQQMVPANGKAKASSLMRTYRVASENEPELGLDMPLPEGLADAALAAHRLEPLNPKAPLLVALDLRSSGQRDRANELMQLILRLSRRETIINLWAVEYFGGQNDINAVLESYDVLLRTSNGAAEQILPLMGQALTNENSLEPFQQLLERNPPWENAFWSVVSRNTEALQNVARLRLSVDRSPGPVSEFERNLVARLVTSKLFNEAVAIRNSASDSSEQSEAELLYNSDFNFASQVAPLDWELTSDTATDAWIDPESSTLLVELQKDQRSLLAKQLFVSNTNKYELSLSFGDQSDPVPVELLFRCVASGKALIRIQIDSQDIGQEQLSQILDFSSGNCPEKWLEVYSRETRSSIGSPILSFDFIRLKAL